MSYDRLTHPLVREDGVLRRATWDEALERAAEGVRRNVAKHGPDCFAMRGTVLMVSGRASFELVQKAVMGGVPVLAAVSAPSSPAVELATKEGLTLIGFLRRTSMNVYAGERRLNLTSGAGNGSAGALPPG